MEIKATEPGTMVTFPKRQGLCSKERLVLTTLIIMWQLKSRRGVVWKDKYKCGSYTVFVLRLWLQI